MNNYEEHKRKKYQITLSIALLSTFLPTLAESIDVITQDGTPISSITREQVADLFLGKQTIAIANQTLTPIDISDENLREAFYQSVANMSAARVNAYWARLVFSTLGRPPRKLSIEDAKSLMQYQTGIVTYLQDAKTDHFKILLRLP